MSSKTQDDDPAIFVALKEGALHNALARPNAPCAQGTTATESGKLFHKWLYSHLSRSIPISEEVNGLFCIREGGENQYYQELLTRLTVRQVQKVEENLSSLFNERNPRAGTVAEWSHNCQRHGYLIGHIFVVGRQGIDLLFAVL